MRDIPTGVPREYVEGEQSMARIGQSEDLAGLIERLRNSPLYERKSHDGGELLAREQEGEAYMVRQIENEKDPALKEAYDLLQNVPGGTESFKEVKTWFADVDEMGIGMSYARDYSNGTEGKIVAANIVGALPVKELGSGGKITDSEENAILVGWYAATDKDYKTKRVTEELFPNALEFGAQMADRWDMHLKAFVTEAVDPRFGLLARGEERGSEKLLPFYETQDGTIKEVPYASPEGEQYHLLVKLLDGRSEMTVSELLDIVRTVHIDYELPEKKWKPAYEQLAQQLQEAKDGKIVVKSYADLKQDRAVGKTVEMHQSTYKQEKQEESA